MSAVKRIVVFGPESTGKTTLTQRLAAHFGEPWSAEFVREFWDLRHGEIGENDLDRIARGQIANEDAASARAARIVFCDTDLLTCVLWDDLLFPGHCPPWVRAEAERRARLVSLYLLCDTDVPFAFDPQRTYSDPTGREMCRRLWRETLESRGLPHVLVHGSWSERDATAIAAVDRVLAAGRRPDGSG